MCKKLLIRFLLSFNSVLISLSDNVRESPERWGHVPERRKTLLETSVSRDTTAQELLSRFSDTENYPDEHLAPTRSLGSGPTPTTSPQAGSSTARTRVRKR